MNLSGNQPKYPKTRAQEPGRLSDDSDIERGPVEPNPPHRHDEERRIDEEE